MTGSMEVMPPIIFTESVIAMTMKFTWMTHKSSAIMRLFFHKIFIIFNTLLLMLSKTLFTSVVKFHASSSEHITSGTGEL
jgi:hypothetical protein